MIGVDDIILLYEYVYKKASSCTASPVLLAARDQDQDQSQGTRRTGTKRQNTLVH